MSVEFQELLGTEWVQFDITVTIPEVHIVLRRADDKKLVVLMLDVCKGLHLKFLFEKVKLSLLLLLLLSGLLSVTKETHHGCHNSSLFRLLKLLDLCLNLLLLFMFTTIINKNNLTAAQTQIFWLQLS